MRRGRPLFLIDLAVPRDVAPEVDSLYNVFVYNLDDIARIANENLEHRRQEIEQAKLILDRQSWSIWLDVRRRCLIKEYFLNVAAKYFLNAVTFSNLSKDSSYQ